MSGEFETINQAVNNTTILGMQWIIPIALAGLIILIITRNTNKWKILAFSVLTALTTIGIPTNAVILIISGIVFVLESIGLEIINIFVSKK